jgi:hypothetical protein
MSIITPVLKLLPISKAISIIAKTFTYSLLGIDAIIWSFNLPAPGLEIAGPVLAGSLLRQIS